jgi:hypothetical protein
MAAERAIFSRWLRLGGAWAAGIMAVLAMLQVRRIQALEQVSAAQWCELGRYGCWSAAAALVTAGAFAATHVFVKLRETGILVAFVAAGVPIGRLRRVCCGMGILTSTLVTGLLVLARCLDRSPPRALWHAGGAWAWRPWPELDGYSFDIDTLRLEACAAVAPAPLIDGPHWAALPAAGVSAGAAIAFAGVVGLVHGSRIRLLPHAAVMQFLVILAALGFAHVGAAAVIAPLSWYVLDRMVVRRGLRRAA